jgi:large subunit ribosomal protein L24
LTACGWQTQVEVISGRDSGKQGVVLKVIRKQNKLIVDGVHMRKVNERASPSEPSVFVMKPGLLHYSNVNLVDPQTGKATRVAYRFLEDGTKVRVAKKSGVVIPMPETMRQRSSPRPTGALI